MCPSNIILWYFVFLLVTSSSKSQKNSTNDDEWSENSTMPNDSLENSVKYRNDKIKLTQCNSSESSVKTNDKMQYESSINFTKNDCNNNDAERYESNEYITKNHEQSNETYMESHANSTKINDFMLQEINENLTTKGENDSKSNELYENSNTNNYKTTAFVRCDKVTCIQLCCPFGGIMDAQEGNCILGQGNYFFPSIYGNENKRLHELFPLIVRDPCILQGFRRNWLNPNEYLFTEDGSVFQMSGKLILPTSYCLAIVTRDIYDVIICSNEQTGLPTYLPTCLLVSMPFLLLTFIVYSILPELQNTHGYILRSYVASLFIMYPILYCRILQNSALFYWKYCVALAYFFNFLYFSSFCWVNVIGFDIWWTFRGLQSNRKKQDKKKFMMYLLYAWGMPFIHSVICAIIDNAPNMPKFLVRPEICEDTFWLGNRAIKPYVIVPTTIIIISNLCFFITTMLTILHQNILTTHQMRDDLKTKHDTENKRLIYMYLKLFILMGLTMITDTIANFCEDLTMFYPTIMINNLQGVIIFIIFVCTKKNKQLLLKRFNEWNCLFCKIPTTSGLTR